MSSGHNQHDAGHYPHEVDLPGEGHHGPRTLPAVLNSPELLAVWRTRALMVAAVATVLSLPFLFVYGGRTHMLRAYLLGYMLTFSFAGGGLALLMLQYVSGGKWGMLIRRPLEAMSRTLWLVAALFIPIGLFARHLYQWALYPTRQEELAAAARGAIDQEQALTANLKHNMFSPMGCIIQTVIIFSVLITIMTLLNKWSLQRDADPAAAPSQATIAGAPSSKIFPAPASSSMSSV